MTFTRRAFISAAASSALVLEGKLLKAMQRGPDAHEHSAHVHPKPARPAIPRLPVLISKVTATAGIDEAYLMLVAGRDTLDAALHLTTLQEDDPEDQTTGIGGLPTATGEVQLDAACLHGPTRRGAAVAGVRGIRNVSLLAQAAMRREDFPLLVGPGAQNFALSQGYRSQQLLTDRSRRFWAAWKHIQMTSATWGSGLIDPSLPGAVKVGHFLPPSQQDLNSLVRAMESFAVEAGIQPQWTWRAAFDALFPAAEPLYVGTLNADKDLSAVATGSGLPWRRSGLASDIPVLGAGCFLDPEVGSAGASGHAAANLKTAGARTIVANLRAGMSPEEAGMDALQRIARWYRNDRAALRFIEIVYFVLRADGAYAGVSLWQGDKTGHIRQFAIHDGERRVESCLYLLEGSPSNG